MPDCVFFVQMDVTNYGDNIKLFDFAHQRYGRVYYSIACAGILEQGKWFDPELTIESVKIPESNATMVVNLLGASYFARIAIIHS